MIILTSMYYLSIPLRNYEHKFTSTKQQVSTYTDPTQVTFPNIVIKEVIA